jgi:hypothetical protein
MFSAMKNSADCCYCFKPKATLECVSCHESVCKNCAQFVDDDSFSLLAQPPASPLPGTYCPACFAKDAEAAIDSYNRTANLAKDVYVFFNNQGKETRLLKRAEDPVRIEDRDDRDEALLCLAFQAVHSGFDALVDVELIGKKVGESTNYRKLKWDGIGMPAHYNEKKIGR